MRARRVKHAAPRYLWVVVGYGHMGSAVAIEQASVFAWLCVEAWLISLGYFSLSPLFSCYGKDENAGEEWKKILLFLTWKLKPFSSTDKSPKGCVENLGEGETKTATWRVLFWRSIWIMVNKIIFSNAVKSKTENFSEGYSGFTWLFYKSWIWAGPPLPHAG